MYDKYDSPHGEAPQDYDSGPSIQEQVGDQAAPIVDALKANWKLIVAALVIIVVAYFAYDFFIGSYRDVTVQAVSTEGESIPASIKITNFGGQTVATVSSGQATRLKLGSYTISAAASGYKPKSASLTVSDSTSQQLELEADKDIRLAGDFPSALVSGDKKELQFTLTNNESSNEKVQLVAEGDAAKDFTMNYKTPIDAPPGDSIISVTLNVLGKSSAKDGEQRSGTIRIKGLRGNASIDAKYTLMQFDSSKLDTRIAGDRSNVDFGTLSPGEHKQVRITFDNRNSFDITGLTVIFHAEGSDFDPMNDYNIGDWFTLSPKGAVDLRTQDNSKEVQLDLAVPRGVVFPAGVDTVKAYGTIAVSNSYYSTKFTYAFSVKKPEAKLDIDMDLFPTIRNTGNGWPQINSSMRVINKGRVDLSDIRLQVSCYPADSQWLTLLDSASNDYKNGLAITGIAAGQDKTVPYRIQAPATTKSGDTSVCTLRARYNDPNGTADPVEKTVTITAQ